MQLYLSNLVDLALGLPKNLESENINFLHALLHVMLKKLNLDDSRIELVEELADKAEKIMSELSSEPSLHFREYSLRPNGARLRKRTMKVICPKKSLIQINRNWPNSEKTSRKDSESSADEAQGTLNGMSAKIDETFKALNQKLCRLDLEQRQQVENQTQINHLAMQEFQKFKTECEEKIKSFQNRSSISTGARKLNGQGNEKVHGDSSEICESEYLDLVSDIEWLKEQMLEISKSLKLHSECLRNLHCDEIPKIQETQHKICGALQSLRYKSFREFRAIRSSKEIDNMRHQMMCVSSQIEAVESRIQATKGDLMLLRCEMTDKIEKCMSDISLKSEKRSIELPSETRDGQQFASNANNDDEMCSSVSQIDDQNKEFPSRNACMQQLAKDISSKLDRCEFQIYIHRLSSTINSLMQMKQSLEMPVAAGGSIPMLKRVNCLSCQGTTNMYVTASSVPRLRPAANSQLSANDDLSGCGRSTVSSLISCSSQSSGERMKRCCGVINHMRYRRIKTASRPRSSAFVIHRNRFHKRIRH